MKRILLITTKTYGYGDIIIAELEKKGYIVDYFDIFQTRYKNARKIKNIFIRLYNDQYLKKIKGIDLKDRFEGERIIKDLEKVENNYDIFLKIGPVYLSENILEYLKNRIPICISHHWDSSIKMSKCDFNLEKKYFNKISSFDKRDIVNYQLDYLPNFYIYSNFGKEVIEYDIYSLMAKTGDKRENLFYKIAEECNNNNIKIKFTLYDSKISDTKNIVTITNKVIPFTQMLEEQSKSKAVLELCHSLNKGYTFRTFDCIGMRKKLITNNKDIINEDFYNPNNILIIDEKNINIPREFIDSPYEDLPEEIYEKYSLGNWIKQLLDVK